MSDELLQSLIKRIENLEAELDNLQNEVKGRGNRATKDAPEDRITKVAYSQIYMDASDILEDMDKGIETGYDKEILESIKETAFQT